MFYSDHAPPHFHAIYNEYELVVGISRIKIMYGAIPSRVRSMVLEWAALHQQELLEDWERCQAGEPPVPIEGLE